MGLVDDPHGAAAELRSRSDNGGCGPHAPAGLQRAARNHQPTQPSHWDRQERSKPGPSHRGRWGWYLARVPWGWGISRIAFILAEKESGRQRHYFGVVSGEDHCQALLCRLPYVIEPIAWAIVRADLEGVAAMNSRITSLFGLAAACFLVHCASASAQTMSREEVNRQWTQANKLHQQEKFAEAAALFEKILSSVEVIHGKNGVNTAAFLSNMGLAYRRLHRFEKAEAVFQRSLAIREASLGKDDPTVAASVADLGLLYHNMGQETKAETFYLRLADSGSEVRLGARQCGHGPLPPRGPVSRHGPKRQIGAPLPALHRDSRSQARQGPPQRRPYPRRPGHLVPAHVPVRTGRIGPPAQPANL